MGDIHVVKPALCGQIRKTGPCSFFFVVVAITHLKTG
uniref:Uncharacterized protein n=1 Tax=Lepeophtheirus salmonis TaxID=72036 RepID=A0A0K2U582_LEPSM